MNSDSKYHFNYVCANKNLEDIMRYLEDTKVNITLEHIKYAVANFDHRVLNYFFETNAFDIDDSTLNNMMLYLIGGVYIDKINIMLKYYPKVKEMCYTGKHIRFKILDDNFNLTTIKWIIETFDIYDLDYLFKYDFHNYFDVSEYIESVLKSDASRGERGG